MIKDFLSRLLPHEDKFFRLLESLSACAQTSAQHLKTFVESNDKTERERAAQAIRGSKAAAKTASGEITKQLCLTYITPFDREDIQAISSDLQSITKMIDKVCQRLTLHNLASEKGDFPRQIDLIVQEAAAMKDMVRELTAGKHSGKQVMDKAAVLRELENKGDVLLVELMANLFKEQRDVRDLILRKDVYDMLEKVIDRFRDVAGVALQIVLKHS